MDETLEVLTLALAESICEMGIVPSDRLYGTVSEWITRRGYEHIIDALVKAELVQRSAQQFHAEQQLTWVGPVHES